MLVQDLFQQIIELKVDSVGPRRANNSFVLNTHGLPTVQLTKLHIYVQVLPHAFLTLPIVGFQSLDPGVALLWTAGVAIGSEFL